MKRRIFRTLTCQEDLFLTLLLFSYPMMFIFHVLKITKIFMHGYEQMGVLTSSSWWDSPSLVFFHIFLSSLPASADVKRRHARVLLTFSLLLEKNHNLFVYPGFCVTFVLGQQSSNIFCLVEKEPNASCNASSGCGVSPDIRV